MSFISYAPWQLCFLPLLSPAILNSLICIVLENATISWHPRSVSDCATSYRSNWSQIREIFQISLSFKFAAKSIKPKPFGSVTISVCRKWHSRKSWGARKCLYFVTVCDYITNIYNTKLLRQLLNQKYSSEKLFDVLYSSINTYKLNNYFKIKW